MNHLLIEYSGNKIRILQANQDRIIFIDQLEFIDSGFFYLEPKINQKKVAEFTELLISHLKKHQIIADSIKLVLDSRLAFINCIPLDFSDESESINSSLIWELSNYFPDTYKGFKVNYQKLNRSNEDLAFLGNTLMIAYHKNIAEVTRRIAAVSSLKISSVNFDVFSAGKFVLNNFNKDFVSAGIKSNRIDLLFYLNGELTYFMPLNVKDGSYTPAVNEMHEILKNPGLEDISNIYLYGEDTVHAFKNALEKVKSKYSVCITDPFAVFKPDSMLLENRPDKLVSHSFTPLSGLL